MAANPALLLSFARDNNTEGIEAVVQEHGVPVNWSNKIGQTALHIAALHGHLEAASKLLDLGIDVNVQNQMQQTPLHFAANAHNNVKEICQLLLDAGGDTGICDFRGVLPYEQAQDPDIRLLLDGPDPRIFEAAARGDVSLLKTLFEEDPELDPSPFGTDDMAPLHLAAKGGHLEALEFLLEKKAYVDQQDLVQGNSALHHAVLGGHATIISALARHGANIDIQNFHPSQYSHGNWMANGATLGPMHQTPLALAAENGEVELVEMFLGLGAAVDPQDFDGRTPLQNALEVQDDEIVELLIDNGADVTTPCKDFGTLLHLASSQGQTSIVRLLLQKGSNVNASDENGWTPLMLAARGGKKAVIQVLLEAGADVEAVNAQGNTALHLAAANNKLDVVKMLFECESGKKVVGVKNKEGKVAKDLTSNEQIVTLLQE